MSAEYVEKLYNRYSPPSMISSSGEPSTTAGKPASELLDLFVGAHLLEVGVGTGLSIPTLPRNITISAIDPVSKKCWSELKRESVSSN